MKLQLLFICGMLFRNYSYPRTVGKVIGDERSRAPAPHPQLATKLIEKRSFQDEEGRMSDPKQQRTCAPPPIHLDFLYWLCVSSTIFIIIWIIMPYLLYKLLIRTPITSYSIWKTKLIFDIYEHELFQFKVAVRWPALFSSTHPNNEI